MASQRSSARSRDSLYLTPLQSDGAEETLQVPGASRPSISTSRRPSTSGRSHRSHSTTLTVADANKLMAEALAIQEQHDLPACGTSRKSSLRPNTSDEDGNRRLSVRPEAHYASASNYSRSRRSLSVVAEDPSLLFARALKDHQQSKDLFRSESKRKENEEQRLVELSSEELSPQHQGHDDTAFTITSPYTEHQQAVQQQARTSPYHHRRRTTIHTTLPSWTRFASHTRALRSASATDPGIIIRDFADPSFRRNATANISQFPQQTYRETLKHLAKNCTSVAKYYATRLTSPEGYRGVNRRTSVSVAKGGVREPELEMISLSPGPVSSGIGEGSEECEVGGGGMEVGREEHRLLLERVERELREDNEDKVEGDRWEGRAKGKEKVKGRPMGLKLDLTRARSETELMRADSGFEGVEGARPGTPFVVEKTGFDWGSGLGGGREKREKRSGTFEFSFQQSSRRQQNGVGPKTGSGQVNSDDDEEQAP